MGKGISKRRNAMKRQFINTASKYIQELEAELVQLKTDPETAVGKMTLLYRESMAQNGRLSVLAATLIDQVGGKATVKSETLDSFKDKRLRIKWQAPEGVENIEKAEEVYFTYDAVPEGGEFPNDPELTEQPIISEAAFTSEEPEVDPVHPLLLPLRGQPVDQMETEKVTAPDISMEELMGLRTTLTEESCDCNLGVDSGSADYEPTWEQLGTIPETHDN